jgi:hypothetical protein
MAARFWVTGGTGNWNSTTNWSATSGGASGASVPGSADTAEFDASSGAGTATLDISPTIQTLTCTGFTGTLAFGTNTITLNSTGTIFTGATTMAVTGTPQIICTNSSATSRTISPTAVTEANSISFRVTAGTGTFTITSTQAVRDLDFTDGVNPTGYAGALNNSSITIYGNFKASTGMTRTAGATTYTFAATSGTKTINTAGVTFDNAFTFNGVGGTWQLVSALTSGSIRTTTLTSGTLDLNGYTLTTGVFAASNANIRTLAFGSGNITITANNATVWTNSNATNFTVTGTPTVNCIYSGSVGTRTLLCNNTSGSELNVLSFNITSGSDIVVFTAVAFVKNINFTGFTGTLTNTALNIYGDATFASGMTVNAGTSVLTFAATSGTKTINTAGVTIDRPFTFNGIGGTWQLQAALTSGATRTVTLTNGTLDLAGYTLTSGGFSSNNSNVRALAFGAGKIVVTTTTGTPLSMSTVTNFTYTGTSRIEVTASGAGRTLTPPSTNAVESNVLNIYVTTGSDTLTISGAARFLTFDLTGFSGTLTYASNSRYFGDLVFSSGMTLGSIGSTGFFFAKTSGTQTITSAGKTIGNSVTVEAPGATVSLQDALSLTGALTLTNGTLTTNGYAVSSASFSSSNTNTRALNLGASAVTLSSTGTPWTILDPTNMTLNAGTSSITTTGNTAAITFNGGGLTYYNVTFGATYYNYTLTGANTYNNLTVASPAAAGRRAVSLTANQTVNGTLTAVGSAANSRPRLSGSNTGTTITAAAVSLADTDFGNIIAAGVSSPWSGTRLGNGGGNTSITFATPKTVYWNQPAGGNWSDVAWALTSGGAVGANNFPLAQDSVILDNTGVGASSTIAMDYGWLVGSLSAASLTNALTINWNVFPNLTANTFGNVTLSSAVTITYTSGAWGVSSLGATSTITTAGVSIPIATVNFSATSNTLVLGDNFTSTGNVVGLVAGTLNLNGKTLSCVTFDSTFTDLEVRVLAFNGGQINVTGNAATVWACENLTNFSYTGTPTVNFTYSGGTGTRTINNGATGATESNVVDFNVTAGTDQWTATAPNSVRNLNFTGFSGTTGLFGSGFIYGNLTLSPTQTITSSANATTFAATSGTKTITTNGVTIDRQLVFSGIGGTWQLGSALTLGATNGNIRQWAGTLTTNNYALTFTDYKAQASTAVGNRTLNLGSSAVTLLGSSLNAAWQAEDGAYALTINAGTSTIYLAEAFTGATRQDFYGGGKTYYNVVYSGGQPGGFYNSSTFNSISNTAQPLALVFEAGTTQTVNNFNVSGTAGNLVTMTSATPGTQWGLAKRTGGKVLVSYVSITDSAATPAGYWFAPTSQGNVNGGNNTGWNFASTGQNSGFMLLL